MSSNYDDDQGRDKIPYTAKELATSQDELGNLGIDQSFAASSLSEEVVTKESQLDEKHKQTFFATGTPGSPSSCTKAITTLAFLLLAAIIFQTARAEPMETSMPCNSLTLPAPTPHVTTFAALSNASETIDTEEKDRPQTSYWHPNSSQRTSTSFLMMFFPLFLICYFTLASVASGTPMKRYETVDATNLGARSAAPEASPILVTYYSTTTVFPPAFGAPTPNSVTSGSAAHATDAVSGSRQSSSLATESNCKGSDPVACSIEMGRNPQSSASLIASRSPMLEVTLVFTVAGFVLVTALVA